MVMLLLLSTLGLTAQVKVGPRAGIASPSFSGSFQLDKGFTYGLLGGGVAEFALGELVQLRQEALFIQKGVLLENDTASFKTTYGYVETPLLLQFTFGEKESFKYYLNAGPYLGFWMYGRSEVKMAGEEIADGAITFADDLGRLDFGFDISGGLNIRNFIIELRYGLGISDLTGDGLDDQRVSNRVPSISIGYLFEID